jgi:hypothetical protein
MPCSRTSCAMVRSLEEPEPALVRRFCRQKPMPLAVSQRARRTVAVRPWSVAAIFCKREQVRPPRSCSRPCARDRSRRQALPACLSAPVSLQGWRSRRTRTCCGMPAGSLVNKGTDGRTLQTYLGHKNIQHTVRYTELMATRFKNCGDEQQRPRA